MKNMLPINDEDDFQPRKSNCKLYGRMKNKMASKHCSDSERSGNKGDLYTPLSYSLRRVTRSCENNSEISIPSSSQGNVQMINNMRKPKGDQLEREMKMSDDEKLTVTKDTHEQDVIYINSAPASKKGLKSPANVDLSTDNCSVQESEVPSVGPCDENIEVIQEIQNESVKEHDRNNMKTSSNDSSFDKTKHENDSLEKVKNVTAELISDIHSNLYNCVYNSSEETFKSFSCPLCWKTFEKNQAQIGHMKICAARHNMTTRQLLDAIKLQERQAGERRAMGLPHIPVAQTTKKSIPKKTGGSGSDGNLQLALALSASLQEAEECEQLQQADCLLEAGLGHEVVERQKMMLERYGFTSSRPAILPSNNPRSRPSSKNNTTAVLKRRTKEERERQVTEKVAIILMEDENKLMSDSSHTVEPISTSERLQKYQITTPLLWDKVSCLEKEQHSYYVRDLSNFISPNKVDVGVKLKHLSQVPGRIKTPEKKMDPIITEKDPYSSPGMKAVPLKELDKRSRELKSRSCLDGLEQYADESTFIETFVNDWRSILNKKTMSDLTIYVEKDEGIPAHKLVFYTRCRSVLQDIVSEINVEGNNETTEMLLWVDVSYQAALAFLQFVYCGLTSKFLSLDEEDMLSVKKLAQRYQVLELMEHLKIVGRVQNRASNYQDLNSSLLQKQSAVHNNITRRKKKKTSPCNKLKCASTPQTVHLERTSEKPGSHSQASKMDKRKHSVSGCIFGERKGMELETSEDSEQCSIRSTSPDLFVDDAEQSDERVIEEPSQESTSNRNCLLSMINKPLSTQSSPRKELSEKFSHTSPAASCPKTSPKFTCNSSSNNGNNNTYNNNNSHSSISGESSTDVRERNMEINSSLLNYLHRHSSTDSDIISEPNGSCSNSPMGKKVQKTVLENLHESSQPETCVNPLIVQNSHAATKEELSFNKIDFLENLLSDSSSPQKKLKQTSLISKRKHSGIDPSSQCSSARKKLCRDDVNNETLSELWKKMAPEDKEEKSEKYDNIIESFTTTTNVQTEKKQLSIASGREHLQNGSGEKQYNSCRREMCRESMGNKRRFEAYDDVTELMRILLDAQTELEAETSTSKEFNKENIEIFDLTQSTTDSEDENINPQRSKCVEPEPQGVSAPGSKYEEHGSQNSSPQRSTCEVPGPQDLCPPRGTYEGPQSQDTSLQASTKEPQHEKPQDLRLRKKLCPQPQLQWSSPLRGLSPPRCMQDEVIIQDVNQQKNIYKKDEPEPQDLSSPRKMSAEPEDLSSPRNISVEPQDLRLPRNTYEELEFNTVDSDDTVVFMSKNSDKEVEEHSKLHESSKCNDTTNNKIKDGNRILDVIHAENDLGSFPGIECEEQEFSTIDSDDTVAFMCNNRYKEVEDHSKLHESNKCNGTTNNRKMKDGNRILDVTCAENDMGSSPGIECEEQEFSTIDSDDTVAFMCNDPDKTVEDHRKSHESNKCNDTTSNKMKDGNKMLDNTHAENDLDSFPRIWCEEQEFNTIDNDDTVDFVCYNSDKEVEDHNKLRESSKCNGTTNRDGTKMLDDTDAENEWDSFDELCNAAVPHIFSQCLTTLLLTKHTSPRTKTMSGKSNEKLQRLSSLSKPQIEEDKPGMNSSHSSSLNGKPCKSKRELSFKTPNKKSSENRGTSENSVIAELNESVFWRDENAPVLQASPRKSLLTSKYGDYMTPTQQGKKNAFLDKVTPPADYSAMKTPQLKKELKKYGLKPSLTRKQAKTMLRHIYDQLHPYITISDTEASNEESSQFKKPDSHTQVPRSPVKKGSVGKISGSPVRRNIMSVQDVCQRNSFKSGRNLKPQSDVDSDSDVSSSQESSSSSTMDIAEEMFCDDSETSSQKVPFSQDACSATDLATRVHHFITSDPELHHKVLLYEPIWIEKLHADLKANSYKFNMNQLMDYLDEQCITFRSARGQQNRQRKKLKQDAKKQSLFRKKRGKKKCPASKSSSSTAMNSSNSDV